MTLLTAFLVIKSALAFQPSNQKIKREFLTKEKTTLQMPVSCVEDTTYICLQDPEAVECLQGGGYFLAALPDPCVRGSISTILASLTDTDWWKQHFPQTNHKGPPHSALFASKQAHPTGLSVSRALGARQDTASASSLPAANTVTLPVLLLPLCCSLWASSVIRHVLSAELSRQELFLCNTGLFKTINWD